MADYRHELSETISLNLGHYQRRYFALHVPHEYLIWRLEMLARPDDRCVDLEYDFQQYLETRNRMAEKAAGGKEWETAFESAPHLLAGFRRLVGHWRLEAFMTSETAEVYAEEFASWSEQEWNGACRAVIREHRRRFPLVGDIRAAREDSTGTVPAASTRDQTTARDMARRAELEAAIAALPEDARAELEARATEKLDQIDDRGNLGRKHRMRPVFLRLAYEYLDREIAELPMPEREHLQVLAAERFDETAGGDRLEYQHIMRAILLRQAYSARRKEETDGTHGRPGCHDDSRGGP